MMKIHGTHGVTDMRCSSQFEKGSEKYLIHSVGRDGRIRHWQLDLATAKFCLRLDQKFDKNLEWPAKFVSCGKHQLLVGFKSVSRIQVTVTHISSCFLIMNITFAESLRCLQSNQPFFSVGN